LDAIQGLCNGIERLEIDEKAKKKAKAEEMCQRKCSGHPEKN